MTPKLQTTDMQQDIIIQLKEEIDGLHDALGILHAEIEQLQATVTDQDVEIEALRWHVANRDQELDWLNSEMERFKRISGDLNVDNVFLRTKIEQLQAIIVELEAENTKLRWQILGEHSPSTEFDYMENYARLV